MSANDKTSEDSVLFEKKRRALVALQQCMGWDERKIWNGDDSFYSYICDKFDENLFDDLLIELDEKYRDLKKETRECRQRQWESAIIGDGEYYAYCNETFVDYQGEPFDYTDGGNGTFTLNLITMEYKKKNIWHAKVRVTDSFGADFVVENKACINSRFQGGEWQFKSPKNTSSK